jgi:hypothetical protein
VPVPLNLDDRRVDNGVFEVRLVRQSTSEGEVLMELASTNLDKLERFMSGLARPATPTG